MIKTATVQPGPGEVPRPGVYGPLPIVEGEWRLGLHKIHVGVEECTNGPNVAPVALEEVGLNPAPRDFCRNDIATKIYKLVVEGLGEGFLAEDLDPH